MSNLLFSLNATMPIFLFMVLGYFFRVIGVLPQDFADKLNAFVFKICLPFLLFHQLSQVDFIAAWDTKFVLYCFITTSVSILLVSVLSKLLKKKEDRPEFIQAAYRSSAALLGVAYITNIYGSADIAPLMILGAVPLYNVFAVVVLSVGAPKNPNETINRRELVKKTIWGILTNPILVSIFIGIFWSLLKLPVPGMISDVFSKIGATASPMGLLTMGASIDVKKIGGELKPAIFASFWKLIGLVACFLPFALLLGFRDAQLVGILIMLGSATTFAGFVMAKNMGYDGTLSSNAVVFTTLLSPFTLTLWIYLLRTLGYI